MTGPRSALLALFLASSCIEETGTLSQPDPASGAPAPDVCIDPDPTDLPEGQAVDRTVEAADCDADPRATCVGEPSPPWALKDFQPQSCGFDETYGLDAFVGHRTVVALFAAW